MNSSNTEKTTSAMQLIEECQKNRMPVFIAGENLDIGFQTYIEFVKDQDVYLENRVPFDHIQRFLASKYYTLQVQMARFQAYEVHSDGVRMVFPIRKNSLIEDTRQAERFTFSSDEKVICEILNPYDGKTRLSKTVMDMSAQGIALRTNFQTKLFTAGTYLPELKIIIDGEPYLQTSGQIVYTRQLLDLSGKLRLQVGIKFASLAHS